MNTNIVKIARANNQAVMQGMPLNPNELGSCAIERIIRNAVREFAGPTSRYKLTMRAEQFKSFRALYVTFPAARGDHYKKWTPVLRFILTPNKLRGAQVILTCDSDRYEPFSSRVLSGAELRHAVGAAVRYTGIKQSPTGDLMTKFLNSLNG